MILPLLGQKAGMRESLTPKPQPRGQVWLASSRLCAFALTPSVAVLVLVY
jgi:hypothetical protein